MSAILNYYAHKSIHYLFLKPQQQNIPPQDYFSYTLVHIPTSLDITRPLYLLHFVLFMALSREHPLRRALEDCDSKKIFSNSWKILNNCFQELKIFFENLELTFQEQIKQKGTVENEFEVNDIVVTDTDTHETRKFFLQG